jgi:hypothetical protein
MEVKITVEEITTLARLLGEALSNGHSGQKTPAPPEPAKNPLRVTPAQG